MREVVYAFEAVADVYNVPEYAMEYRYWVVTPSGGRLWFYSAWNFYSQAEKAKDDNTRIILENPNFDKWRKKKDER